MVFTLGHSTRSIEEFLALLRDHGIRRIVDVRRFAGSRRHPHFGKDILSATLGEQGIEYRHDERLGGRRHGEPNSPNTAWRDKSFRAYADHMATAAFRDAASELVTDANDRPTAVLCAEAVPWRCHRQLIADWLVAQGVEVVHVMGAGSTRPHEMNPGARARKGGILEYPAEGQPPGLFHDPGSEPVS